MKPASQPHARQEPVKLSVMKGYSRWAKFYDTNWNTLISTEELYSLAILDVFMVRPRSMWERERVGSL